MEELLTRGARITAVCGARQIPVIRADLEAENTSYRTEKMDVGLVLHPGTLLVDGKRLYEETYEYLSDRRQRAAKEARWLIDNEVDIAVCDMPLWSIEACQLAGVPMQYIGNFTWTEMYREYLPNEIWEVYGEEYKRIKHAMLYSPHNTEMLEFLPNAEIKETSLVARRFHPDKALAIKGKHSRPLIFVALGMSAEFTEPTDVSKLPYDFVTNQGVPLAGGNVEHIPAGTPNTQDYILASDYVITKAGWGTIAECLLAGKPMALFERDTVLEDRTTIRILEEQKLAIKIKQGELEDIEDVIDRMNTELSTEGLKLYYDAVKEIADQVLSLEKEKI
ncbi:MAG: hypothetical protein LUH52_10440 [Bacteroides uniformis]|nr:hypothetical protein [Bacteroides uniformis]